MLLLYFHIVLHIICGHPFRRNGSVFFFVKMKGFLIKQYLFELVRLDLVHVSRV